MRSPAFAVASEASGLVSLPTSSTGVLSDLKARGHAAALQEHLGAFALDAPGRRLSMLRCAIGASARLHALAMPGSRPMRAWMVTLTYRPGVHWSPEHLKACWHRMRAWLNRQGLRARYVWVAELQQRGAVHYHAVVWLPQGMRCPAFDSRGWWPHGMTNRKVVRSSAVGYLMKYLSKGTEVGAKQFPKGCRIYGVAGLTAEARRFRWWLRLPSFVKANASVHDDWKRATGGGWTAPGGQHFASEFVAVLVAGKRCLLRVAEHARSIDASGAFSWLGDAARALQLPQPRMA